MENTEVKITLLEREYHIKCPIQQKDALQQCADYLQSQLQQQSTTQAQQREKQVVVAALNVCHKYLTLKKQYNQQINAEQELIKKIRHNLEINEEIAL